MMDWLGLGISLGTGVVCLVVGYALGARAIINRWSAHNQAAGQRFASMIANYGSGDDNTQRVRRLLRVSEEAHDKKGEGLN